MDRIRYWILDTGTSTTIQFEEQSSFDAFVVYQLPVLLYYVSSPSFGRVLRAIAASQKVHLSPWIKQNRIPTGI